MMRSVYPRIESQMRITEMDSATMGMLLQRVMTRMSGHRGSLHPNLSAGDEIYLFAPQLL